MDKMKRARELHEIGKKFDNKSNDYSLRYIDFNHFKTFVKNINAKVFKTKNKYEPVEFTEFDLETAQGLALIIRAAKNDVLRQFELDARGLDYLTTKGSIELNALKKSIAFLEKTYDENYAELEQREVARLTILKTKTGDKK